MAWVRHHQLGLLVVLAYALSWWAWFWYRAEPVHVDAPILPIGPLLAVLIVLSRVGGWPAVKGLLARIVDWRVGWSLFALALLLPLVLTLSALGIHVLLGAQRVAEFEVPDAVGLVFRFVFIFFWIALGEEPAWRGYALPRLLAGHTALTAAMLLGLIHLVWHAPLYGVEYDSANVLPWGITVFCFSITVCWVYLQTGGSVLMPMVMHASNNTIALVWKMFAEGDQLRLWWAWCVLWVITTGVVLWVAGADLTRKRHVHQ